MLHFLILAFTLTRTFSSNIHEYTNMDLNVRRDIAYSDMAIKCITQIIEKLLISPAIVTLIPYQVKSFPHYETTQKIINLLYNSWEKNILVKIDNGSQAKITFKSRQICVANCGKNERKHHGIYKYQYISKKSSDAYVIFLENFEGLATVIRNLLKSRDTFNVSANFILVYGTFLEDSVFINKKVLRRMYDFQLYRTYIIQPERLNQFAVLSTFLFQWNNPGAVKACGRYPSFRIIGQCINGKLNYSQSWENINQKKRLNCQQHVQLMVIPPMVLSKYSGVEIEILNATGRLLNISFNYDVQTTASDWGTRIKKNCGQCYFNCSSWTKLLNRIENDPYLIGVGRVTVTSNRSEDFAFSKTYYQEDMVWVVPSAELIPPWASIITIFEWPTWATLFSLVILMGILTYVYTKMCGSREFNYLHSISASILVSTQIFFIAVVATQPKSNPVRCLFICYLMFMMIIGSIYQSCLINVLTNPRYEHQIDTEDEVFDSGIGIGGMASRKDIFDNSLSERDYRIYNNYEIYDVVNDTEFQWLLTVAQDRDTITILGRYYAEYFIDQKDKDVVYPNGRAKVHLIKNEVLYTEQASMIFPRTYLLKNSFDQVITWLIEGGFIKHWKNIYNKEVEQNLIHTRIVSNDTTDDSDNDDDAESSSVIVITLDHLLGTFAIYVIGHVAGTLAFISEYIYYRTMKYFVQKHIQNKIRWKRLLMKHRVNPYEKIETAVISSTAVSFGRYKKRDPNFKLRFIKQETPRL